MMSKSMKVAVALAAAMSLSAASAQAQSANINALANVFQAITVTGAANLQFGNVFPGVNKTVDASTNANSGRFDLTGQASQNLALTFTLPTNLDDGATHLLPIATWTGCLANTASQAGCASFTPSAGATNTTFSGASAKSVYVGATVSPAAAQVAGSYLGTVTLTAAYF